MKKLLNICLLLTSLIGYLEWGKDNHAFLFQVEYGLIFGTGNSNDAFLHPFVLVPLCGQLLILFTIFQKTPNRRLTLAGLACLSIIMVFLFLISWIGSNMKMMLSSLPFIITAILVLRINRKRSPVQVRI